MATGVGDDVDARAVTTLAGAFPPREHLASLIGLRAEVRDTAALGDGVSPHDPTRLVHDHGGLVGVAESAWNDW
ncbi:Uncharacterised protein [Mycobacteroides abscessus subsp. abscessus]|nr:Uncharacterised protein [Mycobacteroides abscessus subsp. abscessus]